MESCLLFKLKIKMKQYFAKYLPVEGEIKEGDICKTFMHIPSLIKEGLDKSDYSGDDTFTVGEIGEDRYVQKNAGTFYYKEECQKVKLFLVSRDIQVGDTFTYFDDNTQTEILNLMLGQFQLLVKECKGAKVIGEISLDATWVKEGDEFDEDDVKFLWWEKPYCECAPVIDTSVYRNAKQLVCDKMVDDYRGGDFCSNTKKVISQILIKGPCGHFH